MPCEFEFLFVGGSALIPVHRDIIFVYHLSIFYQTIRSQNLFELQHVLHSHIGFSLLAVDLQFFPDLRLGVSIIIPIFHGRVPFLGAIFPEVIIVLHDLALAFD